ncbi:HAD superfamily hydrolase (TIGR01549 family) [Shimia isoporae]|uniref:HAD superfamily hydrolase (TIGR01549 family) n=1 Tax=Shimia isoporae TaxID=647720 RepID=A0A4R1N2I0_9RHOB|nr:hypothetical protein [Shimia isoporae]TCL00600.1 HAD superfamily hydrolase (TIGR01549 family) [Shimia isoporae]
MAKETDVNFENFKIVSFDIFDTLLHRKVLAPVDVFELVQYRAFEDTRSLLCHNLLSDFAETRRTAEVNARQRRIAEFGGEGEVTLAEIYHQWVSDTSSPTDIANWLKGLELDCEARLLYASVQGKSLYNAARAAGCEILFVSDMYLPPEFVRDRLVSAGFDEDSSYPLYISGEVRLSKHNGTLFSEIARRENLEIGTHWLHVGDNLHSDVINARKAGLTAFHATWANIVNLPTNRRARGSGNAIHSLMEALSEPHAIERMPKDALERIAYQVWGPMLFGFTCWLIAHFRNTGIQHVVFVARDGWLMAKLFKLCVKKVPDVNFTHDYFHMSRKTGFKTGVRDWHPERVWFYFSGKNESTANRVFSAAGLKAEDYLEDLKRVGIVDINTALTPAQKPKAAKALNAAYMDVLKKNAGMRQLFAKFYDDALTEHSRVALVDIGWVGNIQRCFLHSLSDPTASQRVFGYYLGLHRDCKGLNSELGMQMQGWFNSSEKYDEFNDALLTGGVELLEFILTAPHGSTIDLKASNHGIEPVLEVQTEEELEHQATAKRAQSGVMKFVEDYAFLLDWFSPDTLANPAWAEAFLSLAKDPDDEALHCLAGITHSDGPGTNDVRLELAPKLSGREATDIKRWAAARESSFWKSAFDKRNPKPDK